MALFNFLYFRPQFTVNARARRLNSGGPPLKGRGDNPYHAS